MCKFFPPSFLHLNDTACQKDSCKLGSDIDLTRLTAKFCLLVPLNGVIREIKTTKETTLSFISGGINNVTICCF